MRESLMWYCDRPSLDDNIELAAVRYRARLGQSPDTVEILADELEAGIFVKGLQLVAVADGLPAKHIRVGVA